MIIPEQKNLCAKYHATPLDAPDVKAGVAANVRSDLVPVNGLLHPPQGDTTGWYLWAGEELSGDPGFFAPVHIRRLEDVWYDPALLNV